MNIVTRFASVILPFTFLSTLPFSQSAFAVGLSDGKLKPCPESPNCVSSENNPADALPLESYDSQKVWQKLQLIIVEQGGQIIKNTDTYLHAEFHSKWLNFIDDLEARVDTENKVLHLRSASRTGYYDFGVNQKRINIIKKKMYHSIQNENKE